MSASAGGEHSLMLAKAINLSARLLSICLKRGAQAFDHIGNIAGNGRPQKFVIHALVPRMRRDVPSRPQRALLD